MEFTRLAHVEYLVIIQGYCFLFLHKNIWCGYSLEAPHQGTSNEYPQKNMHIFMEKLRKSSKNYHQILVLDKSFVRILTKTIILRQLPVCTKYSLKQKLTEITTFSTIFNINIQTAEHLTILFLKFEYPFSLKVECD